MTSAQFGGVMAVVGESLMDGKDVGIAFKPDMDVVVLVPCADDIFVRVHRVDVHGNRTFTQCRASEVGAT
jgi:hypothetical protein